MGLHWEKEAYMSEKAKELFKKWLVSELGITVEEYENLSYRNRDSIMNEFLDFATNELNI